MAYQWDVTAELLSCVLGEGEVKNLTGPIRPLSGKISLIRYNKDGTILNKNISYSARAKKGSKRNPFLKQGDLISVKNSLLGKSTGIIREFTAPFVGIYSTKEIIESFNDWLTIKISIVQGSNFSKKRGALSHSIICISVPNNKEQEDNSCPSGF